MTGVQTCALPIFGLAHGITGPLALLAHSYRRAVVVDGQAEAIERIGADPTAETPCADTAGVQSAGLLQVITDPRTSVSQCLNALLGAELIDNDSWELLVEVAEEFGMHDMAEEFRRALAEEEVHLRTIRGWLVEATRQEARGGEATA